jgi:PAS domain S-box-containing protein
MSNQFTEISKGKRNRFSGFWIMIVKTRVLLCVVICVFSIFSSTGPNLKVIVASVFYSAINFGLGLVGSVTLRRKGVRVLPATLDVFFISYLVFVTGGENSPWFLLYVFPILSISRYLRTEGSVPFAIFVAMSYTAATFGASRGAGFRSLLLKGLVFLGVAVVTGNLTRTSDRKGDEITDSEIGKSRRLAMLNEIGERLKIEQGLEDLVQTVVALVGDQLNSEEAALFLCDEEHRHEIKKVAAKGPSDEITANLRHLENKYEVGESLIGRIFQTRECLRSSVPFQAEYLDGYSLVLPSRKVQHYVGVPVVIGDEVLGVLRVINKRAPGYSLEESNFELSKNGFDLADVQLLETIASQVAAAIRSAKFLEMQRFHEELIQNSPDPIIVLDKKGRIRVFNKACEAIWGLESRDVIGKGVTEYYESPAHAKEIGALLYQNHRLRDYEARIKSAHGEIIPISLSASLLLDPRGNIVGSIGAFRDLRETLRLQDEKTNAERLATLGKLAHTVGHEIKHDIATALNYVDTLAFETTNEELTEIYSDIQESLGEAVDKFQNMLLVGRPRRPEKEIIGSEDILRIVEKQMRRRADAKGIELNVSYPNYGHEVDADLIQLRQAFLNLFDNSIDAIESKRYLGPVREKGRIELSAEASNGELQIVWKDNGCGIPPSGITNIFTPFVTTKATGNGLGLFIVKNIIENHGGMVAVDSQEGEGTTFRIALPLVQEGQS